jgi:hypothetical protein
MLQKLETTLREEDIYSSPHPRDTSEAGSQTRNSAAPRIDLINAESMKASLTVTYMFYLLICLAS